MRETYAYESQAGNLHKTAEACAAEDLTALSKPDGTDAEQIGMDQAMKLVKNRKNVIALLQAIETKGPQDMPKEKTEYYIAWNASRSEGFISTDKSDVLKALGRQSIGGMEATLGECFRDCYEDQETHIQTIQL